MDVEPHAAGAATGGIVVSVEAADDSSTGSAPALGTLPARRPDLALQWHRTRNDQPTADGIAATSNRSAWWLGPCGHEWRASIANRTNGANCPFCAGKAVLAGYNDLATTRPDVAAEWHPTKNGTLATAAVSSGSEKRAWWLGPCGHEWETVIKYRTKSGSGCPFCAGKAVLVGFNDLATARPDLAAEWHPTKNSDLTPRDLTYGSKKKVWWLGGECGHEWESSPNVRTATHPGCPVCTGRRVMTGVNDLATTHPALAGEWHPTKNEPLAATQVTAGSNKKVWWRRPSCGHEWESYVYDRAGSKETACPRCANHISKGESELHEALSGLLGPDAVFDLNGRSLDGLEVDILIQHAGSTMAIEFNGVYWHSAKYRGRDYHADKRAAALAAGHRFVAVWEDDWRDRRDVVIRGLASRLGVLDRLGGTPRIGARSLRPGIVPATAAAAFLDAHHIQGRAPRIKHHFGLFDASGEVRALLSVKARGAREPGVWEIVRYATSATVPGGFTRLLAHAERSAPEVREWVTFADHGLSEGALYTANGFDATGVVPPDYLYVGNRNGWRREHKFNYRLSRFRTDPTLTYREGASERELAQENGLLRVWDYGKTKYTRSVHR